MIDHNNLLNKWLKIKDLVVMFNTSGEVWNKKKDWYKSLKENCNGVFWFNGRNNHHFIQDAFSNATNGFFKIGGQGDKEPDLYCDFNGLKKRVEMKGFEKKNNIRVSASKFFGSNGGMKELSKCNSYEEKVKLVTSHYKDDFYLLTRTTQRVMKKINDVEEIEFYLIKKEDMLLKLKDDVKVPQSILDLSNEK